MKISVTYSVMEVVAIKGKKDGVYTKRLTESTTMSHESIDEYELEDILSERFRNKMDTGKYVKVTCSID